MTYHLYRILPDFTKRPVVGSRPGDEAACEVLPGEYAAIDAEGGQRVVSLALTEDGVSILAGMAGVVVEIGYANGRATDQLLVWDGDQCAARLSYIDDIRLYVRVPVNTTRATALPAE